VDKQIICSLKLPFQVQGTSLCGWHSGVKNSFKSPFKLPQDVRTLLLMVCSGFCPEIPEWWSKDLGTDMLWIILQYIAHEIVVYFRVILEGIGHFGHCWPVWVEPCMLTVACHKLCVITACLHVYFSLLSMSHCCIHSTPDNLLIKLYLSYKVVSQQ